MAVVVACGCTSSASVDAVPSSAETAVSEEATTSSTTRREVVDEEAGNVSEVEDPEAIGSPLGQLLGYAIPGLDSGPVDSELVQQEQDNIAACMKAEGFAYIPWIRDETIIFPPVDPEINYGTREFAERYGFGVSTQTYAQSDVGLNAVGYTGLRGGVVSGDDPNIDIVESLSEAEAQAYQEAYWGADNPLFVDPGSIGDGDGPSDFTSPFDYGCVGEGRAVFKSEADEFVDVFAEQLNDLYVRIEADEAYATFVAGVEQCVRSEGYDFYEFGQMPVYFDQLVFGDVEPLVSPDPLAVLSEADRGSMTPDEIEAANNAPRILSDEALERLVELQELETAVAVAQWDCNGTDDNLREVRETVSNRLQLEFIEKYGDDIDRFNGG